MNNHQKGFHRDRLILEAIERHGALDTDQVTALYFNGIKNAKRMAQKRLKSLYDRKKVKRGRESLDQPYYYYTNKNGQVEHLLGVNWVYVWLNRSLKSWERLHCFEYEQDYQVLRTDAFTAVKNTITGKFNFKFIEMDRIEKGRDFDKIKKYNDLYESENYSGLWWVKIAERFPPITIVTTNLSRLKTIEERIGQENRNNLEFKVYLLVDIKGQCLYE